MLKHLYILAFLSALSVIGNTAVVAQGASQSVVLSAVVPKFCTIDGAVRSVDFDVTVRASAASTIDTTPQSFVVPKVICNSPSNVAAASKNGGAKRLGKTADVAGREADTVDYIGTITFGGFTTTINTAAQLGAAGSEQQGAGFVAIASVGSLFVTVRTLQPTAPVSPGVIYTDTLRVTLYPR